MAFVKSHSKLDKSTCSFESNGMRCSNEIHKDDEYIFDTEGRKAYCLKHDEINSKVTANKGGPGGFKTMQLVRDVPEGLDACQKWNESVVPMILGTIDKLKDKGIPVERIWNTYEEIFMGKFPVVNK